MHVDSYRSRDDRLHVLLIDFKEKAAEEEVRSH